MPGLKTAYWGSFVAVLLLAMLPICAYWRTAKKIRDDTGYWNQLEAYLLEHSEARFSHGICEDCMKKYHTDLKPD